MGQMVPYAGLTRGSPVLKSDNGFRQFFESWSRVVTKFFEKLKTGQTAVEEETGYGKRSAPAIKRVTECGRREQADPDETADNIDTQAQKESVE